MIKNVMAKGQATNKIANNGSKKTNLNKGKSAKPKGSTPRSQKKSLNKADTACISSPMEVITYHEARKVLEKDSSSLLVASATDKARDSFLSSNCFAYYVCINTWLLIVSDVSANASHALRIRITQKGLIDTISFYSSVSDMILHNSLSGDWDADAFGVVSWLLQDTSDLGTILQLLRFPKKLTLDKASAIAEKSVNEFFEVNANGKIINGTEFPHWLILAVKDKISKMMKPFEFDESQGYFSSGAVADADSRALLPKLLQYQKSDTYIYDKSFQLPLVSDYSEVPRFYDTLRRRTTVLIKAVPKSYKAYRIIAEEPVSNQFKMLGIAQALRNAMRKSGFVRYCDTKDQMRNRQLCREASIDGKYATIDMSHASDSVTDTLVSEVFPDSIVRLFEECRSIYITYAGQRRIMQMFSTSGSGLTFDVESIVFTAIALVAGDYYRCYTRHKPLDPSIFGDDVIIDDRVAETFVDFCELLGFTVNRDKSFIHEQTDGYYRESCGVEYFNGIDVSSKFFPRKALQKGEPRSTASLVSLQKRLYYNYTANLFLRDLILQIEPRMTSHLVGTDCADMWTEEPIFRESKNGHLHLALVSRPRVSQWTLGFEEESLLEHYYYYSFLVNGPRYADDISRLLHVSDPIRNLSDIAGTKDRWDYVNEL